jgi:hypothetical protein
MEHDIDGIYDHEWNGIMTLGSGATEFDPRTAEMRNTTLSDQAALEIQRHATTVCWRVRSSGSHRKGLHGEQVYIEPRLSL